MILPACKLGHARGGCLTCDVDAVGMGATNSEFRTPCCFMFARRLSQSQRDEGAFTPHMSCCKTPLLMGLPSYVSYGPESQDVLDKSSRE